jgi:hypothetical protein
MIVLIGFAIYVVVGVIVALAFVTVGITRVQPLPATLGARILIFPGAAALWPCVLIRWRRSSR